MKKQTIAPQLSSNVPLGKQAPKGSVSPTMKKSKDPPALAKMEEKSHRGFDHDEETGKSAVRAQKVLRKKPLLVSSKGKATSKKMCPVCTKAGKASCSHR